MEKRKFLPFENDLTDHRLDALRHVRADIVPPRQPASFPRETSWQQFIKRLFFRFRP